MGNTAPVAETSWTFTSTTINKANADRREEAISCRQMTIFKANPDRREKEACRLMRTKLYSLALDEWKEVLCIRRLLHGGNLFEMSTIFKEIGTCYYWMGSQSCAIAAWHLYYRACSIDSTIHSTLFGRVLLTLHAWTEDDMQYYDRHAPISVSHEKRGDKYRRLGDYDCALKEYKMAMQVETTFKLPLENPVVAHLVRKSAGAHLDKAKTVARQTTSSDDESLDSTKSDSSNNNDNKEWIQYAVLISLGDLQFGQLKWDDATNAFFRIQIGIKQALLRNNHDQASSAITTGVLPSPLLSTSLPEPYYNRSIAWSILGFMIGICFMILPRRLSMPESDGNVGRLEDLLLSLSGPI
jgi:tetratricopeptide (TPR) repeat protein